MSEIEVGTLDVVELRSVWPDEARDFTPWLADHIDGLAEELGIGGLTVTHQEFAIGSYSLDILAEAVDGRLVAIENQLGNSDHRHLGQCLTYASGTDAWAVVWIVAQFNEEHRSALDWLNQHTDDDVHFFGVEVSAVRIGTSLPAPVFKVVVRPNEWEQSTRRASAPNRTADLEEFLAEVEENLGPVAQERVDEVVKEWLARDDAWYWLGSHSVNLHLPRPTFNNGIWPFGLKSQGWVQFAFQPLSIRQPFDDPALHDEFRRRINAIPGITPIPEDKIDRYPSVRLQPCVSDEGFPIFKEAIHWFAEQVEAANQEAEAV